MFCQFILTVSINYIYRVALILLHMKEKFVFLTESLSDSYPIGKANDI